MKFIRNSIIRNIPVSEVALELSLLLRGKKVILHHQEFEIKEISIVHLSLFFYFEKGFEVIHHVKTIEIDKGILRIFSNHHHYYFKITNVPRGT